MKSFELKTLAGLLCFCGRSQTFQVTTTADSGPSSLRDAMTNAIFAGGGTIVFTNVAGTISLQSNLPSISGTLTILGNGPEHVTINGNQTYRIFNVLGGATCNVSGLAMQGGYALTNDPPTTSRAAIVNGGSLSMSNCFLHDNV